MAKGISLHMGVDVVSIDHYDDEMRLFGCIQDAQAMQTVADSLGYKSTLLLNEQATTRNLITNIREAAEVLGEGDTFFITYSGHGGQVPDFSGDEGDNDETLCLYDRQYRDDEFNRQLARFSEGVKIVWVSDSCHAENNFKNIAEEPEEAGLPLVKSIGIDTSVDVFKAHKNAYQTWYDGSDFLKATTPKLPATLIQLAACKEKQLSRAAAEDDPNPLSLFTKALMSVWNNGHFDGSYQALIDQIVPLIHPDYDQTPQLVLGGQENTAVADSKPFVI